jgi:hypothetical protein
MKMIVDEHGLLPFCEFSIPRPAAAIGSLEKEYHKGIPYGHCQPQG